jgi:hypothetical protein
MKPRVLKNRIDRRRPWVIKTKVELERQLEALRKLDKGTTQVQPGPSALYRFPGITRKNEAIAFSVIAGLILVLDWIFPRWFGLSYLTWYLQNGAVIGLVTSLIGIAWGDLNRNTSLISINPAKYMAGCVFLILVPLHSMSVNLKGQGLRTKKSGKLTRAQTPAEPVLLDLLHSLVSLLLNLMLFSLFFLWLFLIAPFQYLVFAICGAPAREALRVDLRSVFTVTPRGSAILETMYKDEEVPQGWWDASLFSKPVTSTSLISAFLFFLVKSLFLG